MDVLPTVLLQLFGASACPLQAQKRQVQGVFLKLP